MGGASAEREISLQTGGNVLQALLRLGYRANEIDFDDGFIAAMRANPPDAIFNALHGGAGENGTVQAILDWLQIPYQGSGVLASAIAMNKWITKAVMRDAGLPRPRAVLLSVAPGEVPPIPDPPGLPCVVKPVAEGSAVDVSIVHANDEWERAVRVAAGHGSGIVVEEYVSAREFTVAILGERALPVVEIVPADEFYSYHSKYTPGASTHIVPAKIDAAVAARMQDYGLRLHRALDCRDYSRVDMLMNATGHIFLLECNTLPGLTSLSLLPDAARAAGIEYDELVDRLAQMALARSPVGSI